MKLYHRHVRVEKCIYTFYLRFQNSLEVLEHICCLSLWPSFPNLSKEILIADSLTSGQCCTFLLRDCWWQCLEKKAKALYQHTRCSLGLNKERVWRSIISRCIYIPGGLHPAYLVTKFSLFNKLRFNFLKSVPEQRNRKTSKGHQQFRE